MSAVETLSDLVNSGFQPGKLDEYHDLLKLLGVVLAQVALLDVVSNPVTESKDRVSAARVLLNFTKESPENIAERLRRSPFAELTIEQLQTIVEGVKKGHTDIAALVQAAKET
jgi:hypothetical protein